jgi:hypothetical protein
MVLAAASHGEASSAILRGKLIRNRLLCTTLPTPPADAASLEPQVGNDATARERYQARVENTACAGCHLLLDPVGFGFEAYDGLGRYRDGMDASGEIAGTDIGGAFNGAAELTGLLANSAQVSRCFVSQWLQYALGRPSASDLECTVSDLTTEFVDNQRSIPHLMSAFSVHPAFVERTTEVMP